MGLQAAARRWRHAASSLIIASLLHGGPVMLRRVRAIPCCLSIYPFWSYSDWTEPLRRQLLEEDFGKLDTPRVTETAVSERWEDDVNSVPEPEPLVNNGTTPWLSRCVAKLSMSPLAPTKFLVSSPAIDAIWRIWLNETVKKCPFLPLICFGGIFRESA